MALLSFALVAGGCLLAFLLVNKFVSVLENYRFAKAHGCQPPPRLPQPERIIGYNNFKEQKAWSKAKLLLPAGLQRFRSLGNTFSLIALGRKIVVTAEPENVKAILATNFKDFGIGGRYKAMGALLGRGIFTSDGLHWEHSRVTTPLQWT